MAKRMMDTEFFKKRFTRSLPAGYKLLWQYIFCDCDHAGIWIKDLEIAQIYLGNDVSFNEVEALKIFNAGKERIKPFANNSKWFISAFIDFQYGELNEKNRVHKSVISILQRNDLFINKTLISPLQGVKDKDKDKDKDNTIKEKDVCAISSACERIIQLHPKVRLHNDTLKAIYNAIMAEIEAGSSAENAIKVIEEATKQYAIEYQDDNQFAIDAVKWFSGGGYKSVVITPMEQVKTEPLTGAEEWAIEEKRREKAEKNAK